MPGSAALRRCGPRHGNHAWAGMDALPDPWPMPRAQAAQMWRRFKQKASSCPQSQGIRGCGTSAHRPACAIPAWLSPSLSRCYQQDPATARSSFHSGPGYTPIQEKGPSTLSNQEAGLSREGAKPMPCAAPTRLAQQRSPPGCIDSTSLGSRARDRTAQAPIGFPTHAHFHYSYAKQADGTRSTRALPR